MEMHRRNFIKITGAAAAAHSLNIVKAANRKKMNVLFIAVDDMNDWVGCLGGNSQAITPNMDKFAAQQGIVMNKAYCASTVCCPSRTAILTGKNASTTGVYGNGNNLKAAPKAKDVVTLPEYFGKHGYHTLSTGKIFHKHATEAGLDEGQWAYKEHVVARGKGSVINKIEPPPVEGVIAGGTDFAWGAVDAKLEETKDYVACEWGADQLDRDFDDKPFFMAIGVSKPHLPWYVPQEFFDMYPLDTFEAPEFRRDDLDDITDENGKVAFKPSSRFILADKGGMHKDAARAYIAAVSYADACLGVLLDKLAKSKYADNTIVMLWGDHGWHLAEKLHYGKTGLWEESDRVPFIVSVPGVTPAGTKCNGVVSLLDMYPTLLDLCGLPPNPENEGRSFAKLLGNPKMEWKYPTLTTMGFKNHSVFDGRYRYSWYGGKGEGIEELYDLEADPMGFDNLINISKYGPVIARLKKRLPKHNEPEAPKNTIDKARKKELMRNAQ
jgi:arylsulfatase A-like enzyme